MFAHSDLFSACLATILLYASLDWTLFFLALMSATLLPGGSEAYLLYQLSHGNGAYALVFMATIGNVLGSIITYTMGRLAQAWGKQGICRWLSIKQSQIKRAETCFQQYGIIALLFAWLPIIGDPLCLAAGLLRYSLLWFVLVVSIGKLARYTLLAWAFLP